MTGNVDVIAQYTSCTAPTFDRMSIQHNEALALMGFKASGSRLIFDPNVFAQYVQKCSIIINTKAFGLYIYNHTTGVYEPVTEDNLGKLVYALMSQMSVDNDVLWTEKRHREAMKAINLSCGFSDVQFDSNNIIALKNTAYDLDNFEAVPFSPEYLCTSRVPITYDAKAEISKFADFLDQIFLGDKNSVAILQEIVGYTFVNHCKAQRAFFFLGSGANGKSVLADVIRGLHSEAACSAVPLSNFDSKFGLESMIGTRVNIVTETRRSSRISTTQFKTVCCGEQVEVNRKNKQAVTLPVTCKLISLMNHLPPLDEGGDAIARRLLILNFNAKFKGAACDPDIFEKLKPEFSGIFLWAMEGLRRLTNNNFVFTYSEASDKTLTEFLQIVDPVKDFCNEFITKAESLKTYIQIGDAYKGFCEWAQERNIPLISDKRFYTDFSNTVYEIFGITGSKLHGTKIFRQLEYMPK